MLPRPQQDKPPCQTTWEGSFKPDAAWQDKWLKMNRHSPEINAYMNRLESFSKRAIKNVHEKPLLVVFGPNGNGKSHGAKAVVDYFQAAAFTAYERGWWGSISKKVPSAICLPWATLCENRQSGLWRDAAEAEVAALDDAGRETDRFRSGEPTEWLSALLDAREGRFTLVTTNVLPAQWRDQWDSRVEDRLLRNAEHVNLTTIGSYARRGK